MDQLLSHENALVIATISVYLSYIGIGILITGIVICLFRIKIPLINSRERMKDILMTSIGLIIPIINIVVLVISIGALSHIILNFIGDKYPAKKYDSDAFWSDK